ncbi:MULTISPECIES: acetoacetate--CoA ligase [unclassified Wenzhouxiangella]|uniref:acetoacetate--CoA ligase n=1 Tax=unclassified Wenzhouxiangella TaxID=2613841 RepID=UPI000E32B58F|nr:MULTISPECIES: acetoacetate--CoA ligase [unclassified Wenzhouxiangella]RFF27689.1 acetoacetate--CoA ligase [Wenzhouxiangella sp. 15181]RFP69780.1 acetoacetate--CoA ligase [Wenzhouxiangella sp. 15190]
MTEPLWRPSAERRSRANLSRFIQLINQQLDPHVHDWETLYRWSVDNPQDFWKAMWEFGDVVAETRGHDAVENWPAMPGTRWFPQARLNFAENLLRHRDDRAALVFANEDGVHRHISYAELHAEVARVAAALREMGVEEGDRVAAYLPNLPETVIAMLAATSIGAVFSSCSPDFGVQGVMDRFGQIEPKVLFVAAAYKYNGKVFDCLGRVAELAEKMPSIERIVVTGYMNDNPDLSGLERAVTWDEFADNGAEEIEFAQLPFDHPVYILYSSGTTGVPKCIVHGAGGTLLQHLKELQLHTDLRRDDRLFYFTTCGWMMWNWLVSGLAVGSTVVLYDGSPFHPSGNVLWDLVDEVGISVLGTSAKWIAACEKAGVKPRESHRLENLKAILSTGSPLLPESFDYVYRDVADDVQLSSISGGTDIVSCFALGNPLLPVYRGELQCRGLGMKVEIRADDGRVVEDETGELTCSMPFPCMPVKFWNDPDGKRYHKAYFEKFEGVWSHGDYARLTPRGGVVIYGRSDATLNPGGVRIGTAEIYRQVEKLDEILESICVGQDWEGDVRVVLFVRLREGVELDDELRDRIRKTVRANATPRHVPAKIIAVPDIPRTVSGKIVELAVRDVIHGREVKNTSALANPEALEHYRDLEELKS